MSERRIDGTVTKRYVHNYCCYPKCTSNWIIYMETRSRMGHYCGFHGKQVLEEALE
jgi:hypothetical protein